MTPTHYIIFIAAAFAVLFTCAAIVMAAAMYGVDLSAPIQL